MLPKWNILFCTLKSNQIIDLEILYAWVVELVDTLDLKSNDLTVVRVQVPSRVQTKASTSPVGAILLLIHMATFYVIYSHSSDTFYSGSTEDFPMQLEQHQKGHFPKGYTSEAVDWVSFYTINDIPIDTARRIAKHVKKNKSREYFERLKNEPKLTEQLKVDFQTRSRG